MTTDDLLKQGIAALKAGRKAEARNLLMQVVEQDERNEMAWLWLSGAMGTDEERLTCLETVLAVNPNNEIARRGVESLIAKGVRSLGEVTTLAGQAEPATTPSERPMRPPAEVSVPAITLLHGGVGHVTKLNCPSCNGPLELPDSLDVVHCMYCGTRILVQRTETARGQQNLARYMELCKVAVEARNYEEAIQYCNDILQIDPKNIQAWIDKAISTFWLTTAANNRYGEAVEYLRKAAQIASGDTRVTNAYEELNRLQAWWYNNLGDGAFEHAEEVHGIWGESYWTDLESYVVDQLSGYTKAQARQHSSDYYVEAMENYLQASTYAPADITILENIAKTAKRAHWISWTRTVSDKIRTLELLRAEDHAMATLPRLREELANAQTTLARLKRETGLFASLKIKNAEAKVKKIQAEIAKQEKAAAYEAPKVQYKL